MLPVLLEDGSSLDWRSGKYSSNVKIRHGGAVIENSLDGAPQLDKLVEEGSATWALEVRCPRSLFAKTFTSHDSSFEVTWHPKDVRGPVYLMAGMVSVSPVELESSGLLEIWGQTAISVPQGTWLIRGNMSRSENLAASLVVFRRNDELQDGQKSRMSVQEDMSEGEPRFIVSLPSELYETAHSDRTIQVAGLIAACALLPNSSSFDREAENRVAQELREKLLTAGVPLWDGDEEWDPALAATAIEPFLVNEQPDEDSE